MSKMVKAYLERKIRNRRTSALVLGLFAVFYVMTAVAVVSIDTVPLTVANSVPSNLVLVPSVEWPTVVTLANDPGKGDNTSGYAGYSAAAVTSCPAGYTMSGSNCTQTIAATPNCTSPYSLSSSGTSCQQTATPTSACPSGYTLNGTTCQQTVTANAATCPSGYTANGTTCQKVLTANAAACPSGYTANGTACQQTVTANAATCPSGFTANGTSCQKSVTANASTCPSGYTANGTTCQQTVTANAATCPSGFTANGTSCQKSVTANAGTCPSGYTPNGTTCQQTLAANAVYQCPNNYTPTGTPSGSTCTRTKQNSCPSSPQSGFSGYGTQSGSGSNRTCSGPGNVTYNCTGIGGTLSGSSCILTATPSTYTCTGVGGTLSGNMCISTATPSTYTCTGVGGTLSGNTCILTATPSTYTCTGVGGTLSGSMCISTATPSTYTCTGVGGTLSGSSCILSATPTAYTCTGIGGTLSGSSCTLTTTPSTYTCTGIGGTLSGSSCNLSAALIYSCPSGYSSSGTGSGTTCTQTGSGPTYTCSVGTLSGTNCTVTTSVTTQYSPYVGYFNSKVCYAYNYDPIEANRYFYPVSATTIDSSGNAFSCSGQTGGTPSQGLWSGNFLNWATMQAIDTFRLALTGGYRVTRPADGNGTSTAKGADGTMVTKAAGDIPSVTYLQKATTDRWTSGYTDTRSLTTNGSNSTPFAGTLSSSNMFITRVAGLRSQMWFMPATSSKTVLGSAGSCCSATNAIRLPVPDATPAAAPTTWGDQTEATGTGIPGTPNSSVTAIPYNPAYHTLPNAATATVTNGTACGTFEEGCTTATPLCSPSATTSWNGTACVGSTVSGPTTSTQTLCTNSTYPYFYNTSGTQRCQRSSTNTGSTTPAYNPACAASTSTSGSVTTTVTVTFPAQGTPNAVCTLSTTTTTAITGTVIPQYTHTTYGRNQVYAVSIRVKVCDGAQDIRDMCTQYGSYYKPEGLLQKNATKTRYSLFSYLTESDSNSLRVGGVMRARQKLIGPVITGEQPYPERTGRYTGIDNPEWDPATGVFINDPDTADSTYTSGKIGTCASTATPDGSGCKVQYSGVINYVNRFGEVGTGLGSTQTTYTDDPLATLKAYDNLSELYYSAVSYIRGLGNNSVASNLASTHSHTNGATFYYQNADGFPVIEDWYQTNANQPVTKWNSTTPALTTGKPADPMLYSCQTTAVLGIGDTNTNSEQNAYSSDSSSTTGGSNGPFSSTVLSTWIGYLEGTSSTRMNIAALAYWAHLNDLRTDIPNTDQATNKRGQTISTYWVDVVELGNYKTNTTNQYYNATKYGGFAIPSTVWDSSGNASNWGTTTVPALNWFTANMAAWTSNSTTWYNGTNTPNSTGGTGWYNQPSNMYFANNGANMIAGLNAAFTKIQADASGSGASLAANSTQLNTGTTAFQARYFSSVWAGDLTAYSVGLNGAINSSPLWSAATQMPASATAAASRVIKTTTDGTSAGVVDFDITLQSDAGHAGQLALRTALGVGTDPTAQNNMIKYLRGDPVNNTYRSRTTALGDIVDSQPVFVGASDPNIFYGKTFAGVTTYADFAAATTSRKKRVWVAANDGMLHAFNAECTINSTFNGCATTNPVAGAETFAYLPQAVILNTPIANLGNLQYGTSSTVPHQYFNDGELTVADVYSTNSAFATTSSNWHTVLIGTSGRGAAKTIYAFDVTDPTTTPKLLWERFAGDGKSGSNYIGQMTGKPVVAQTANGTWSVLIGNGYNSSNGYAALLQFSIIDGTLSVHTTDESSTTGINNGLAAPAVWLGNVANGISTEAYAGDLYGRVWHFDLSTTTGNVVFVAKDASSNPQPITAGMLIGSDPATANVWLFFGTGRYLTQTDLRDTSVQTWYGIVVEGTNAVTSSTTRSSLGQRTIVAQVAASGSSVAARAISTPTAGDLLTKSGWYLDLQYSTAQGERMVTPNQFQGSLLLGTTRIPTSADPCNPSGSGWVMVISPFTGAPPGSSFFDVNSNGTVGTDDKFTVNGVTYVAAGIGFTHAPNNPIFVGNSMLLSFDDASTKSYNTAGTIGVLKRLTWRELVTQ